VIRLNVDVRSVASEVPRFATGWMSPYVSHLLLPASAWCLYQAYFRKELQGFKMIDLGLMVGFFFHMLLTCR
jgi:hypothetical protein